MIAICKVAQRMLKIITQWHNGTAMKENWELRMLVGGKHCDGGGGSSNDSGGSGDA